MQSFTAIPSWPQSIILPIALVVASSSLLLLNSLWWWHVRKGVGGKNSPIRLLWISVSVWVSSIAVVIVTLIFRYRVNKGEVVICTLYHLIGLAACLAVGSIPPDLI